MVFTVAMVIYDGHEVVKSCFPNADFMIPSPLGLAQSQTMLGQLSKQGTTQNYSLKLALATTAIMAKWE